MWALGDKIASSIVAQTAGIPTLPWSGSGQLTFKLALQLTLIPEGSYALPSGMLNLPIRNALEFRLSLPVYRNTIIYTFLSGEAFFATVATDKGTLWQPCT